RVARRVHRPRPDPAREARRQRSDRRGAERGVDPVNKEKSRTTPEERREYVRTTRTAVFGHDRKDDGPAMSLVHYASDPDGTIVVSTTAGRAKTRAVSRDGKVSLCVLDEQWPPTYLNVYCEATVDD